MATTERTAKALNWTNSASQAGEISSLRDAMSTGNTIFASHINRVATLINNMNGHYHTYDDAYQLATYGNNGDRNNYYEDKNTNSIDQAVSAPTDTTSDTTITASRHNQLVTAINILAYHYHGIDDRTA